MKASGPTNLKVRKTIKEQSAKLPRISKHASEKPFKVAGDAGWAGRGNEGSASGILRKSRTELAIDVIFEGLKWTGVLRSEQGGNFTGMLTDPSGDADPAQVSGFLYQNTSIDTEWIFFGRWLEGATEDYWVWLNLEKEEQ